MTLADAEAETTTFVMPDMDVEIGTEFKFLNVAPSDIIADKAFRDWVAGKFDLNGDNELELDEWKALRECDKINLFTDNVTGVVRSLTGVEYFPKLEQLNCSVNQLIKLDVSKNAALNILRCADNRLTELDVSNNTALGTIDCSKNQLTDLDISKNKALRSLVISHNDFTEMVDISKHTESLMHLAFEGLPIASLDLSEHTMLQIIECGNGTENPFTLIVPADADPEKLKVYVLTDDNRLDLMEKFGTEGTKYGVTVYLKGTEPTEDDDE